MTWTSLIWILLYFAVGWLFMEFYELRGYIWGLITFLGWPVIIVSYLVILVLLVALVVVCAAEYFFDRLFHKRKD